MAVCTTRPMALSPLSQGVLSVGLSRGCYSALYWRSQRNFLQDVHHGTLAGVQGPRRGSKHRAPMVLPARGPATIIVIASHLDGTGRLSLPAGLKRYRCKAQACKRTFNDLTGTLLDGSKRSVMHWIL